ncbi:MAG: hypothetical protein J6Z79_04525 [Clostridia bacterium]|nr:hypothetical protein [Clostridia bacterium]
MKKIGFVLLALCLLLFAASCQGDVKVIEKSGENAAGNDPAGAAEGYVFQTGDLSIAIDSLAEPVLRALGEPKEYYEAPSCAFEGLDKIYTFEHFEVDCYPSPEGDRIQTVFLMDDLVATAEGLRIGDDSARVEALYGKDCSKVGTESVYTKGGMKMKIMIEDGRVTFITYQSCASDDFE